MTFVTSSSRSSNSKNLVFLEFDVCDALRWDALWCFALCVCFDVANVLCVYAVKGFVRSVEMWQEAFRFVFDQQTIQATAGKKDLEKLFKFSQIKYIHFKKILGHQFHGKEIKDVQKEVRTFVAQQQNPEVKPEDILVLRSKATMGKIWLLYKILVDKQQKFGIRDKEFVKECREEQNPEVKPEEFFDIKVKQQLTLLPNSKLHFHSKSCHRIANGQ